MVKTKMSVCKYCGQRAGFLRSVHRECHEKHDAGWNEMLELVAKAAETGSGIDTLQTRLTQVASASYIPERQIRDTLVSGWQRAVDRVLAHGVVSEPVESSLNEFAKTFRFSDDELDAGAARTQLVKSVVLREVLSGKVPSRMTVQGQLPFNLVKPEILVWMFPNCSYCEDRVHRTRIGGYQGVSVRVFKGVAAELEVENRSVENRSVENSPVKTAQEMSRCPT
jgi:hypothetical protein